jgi:hypothetical protein
LSDEWSNEIGQDWKGLDREKLAEYFVDLQDLRLQEPEKQSPYKLSFYTDTNDL